MKRKLIAELLAWNQNNAGTPLLLLGARNTGKTWLILDFIRNNYSSRVYMNLEHNPGAVSLFRKESPELVLEGIRGYFNIDPDDADSVLVLDEVFHFPELLTMITNLSRLASGMAFILISSDCRYAKHNREQIPGDFQVLHLYPMDFDEFLDATGNEWYIPVITEHYKSLRPVPCIVHQELLALFRQFLEVGGMPCAVNEYIMTETIANVPEKHSIIERQILSLTRQNMEEGDYLKILGVYHTLDIQLAKDNKKFQYNRIRRGATARQYASAIQYLTDQEFVLKCIKWHSQEEAAFKLYMADTGMLLSKATASGNIERDTDKYNLEKGLLENYLAQSLYAKGNTLYFWESKSQARIEFLLERGDEIVPVEIRRDEHTRSKNISIFKKQQGVSSAYKISAKNFGRNGTVIYLPMYAIFCI